MDTLLRVGLSNAVAACALAVIVAAVGYFCRRPAVRHALWLLVLLKLVTPPLIDVPVWHAPPAEAAVVEEPPALAEEPPEVVVELTPAPAEDGPAPAAGEEVVLRPEEPAAADVPASEDEAVELAPAEFRGGPAELPPIPWRPLAGAVWLGGSALWLLLAGLRARRFTRLLRYAEPAPAWLQREAGDLAARLGLPGTPDLRLLPGRVSPMLWAPGWAARLLLPAELLGRLAAVGRRTLLAHELAHLRRGDHRVRLFELLVTALFWWHPVVWWARRELREAEEQCCDAWVLFVLPESAKAYALALVETVDFLSEAPAALPALASGIGHVHDLKRRVTMIMQGTTPRALTWGGVLGLLGLGAFLLPVAPSWAQEEPGDPIRVQFVRPAGDVPPKAADELQALKANLEKARAELARAEAMLKAAQERRAKAAADAEKATVERRVIVLELVDGDKRQVIKLPAGSHIISSEPLPAKGGPEVKSAQDAVRQKFDGLVVEAKKREEKALRLIIEVISDGKRQVIELPPGSRVISGDELQKRPAVQWEVKPGQPGQPLRYEVKPVEPGRVVVRPTPADTDKRIADLEKKLDELMRSVKELHGELNKGKSNLPTPPAPPRIPNRQDTPKAEPNNPFLPTPPQPPQPRTGQ